MSASELIAPIVQQVSIATGVKPESMVGSSGDSPIAKARQTALCLAFQLTALNTYDIAGYFHRDVAALYYAMDRVVGRCTTDPVYRRHYKQLLGKRKPLRQLHARKRKPKVAKPADLPVTIASDIVAPSTHGSLHQLSKAATVRKLSAAEDQHTYWSGVKASSTSPEKRVAAGVRILIWAAEIAACQRRLRELTRTETLTA